MIAKDFAPQDRLLDQVTVKELEKAETSVFKSLEKAWTGRDRGKVEVFALQLYGLARYIRRRGESGQALVEAAFILPLFILMLVVTIDLGAAILDRQIIQAAAAEAARYGTTACDPRVPLDMVQAEALARTAGMILGREPEATATATGFSQGDLLTISITAKQSWILFPVGQIAAESSARYQ